MCPWFTVLTLYLQGLQVQGCMTILPPSCSCSFLHRKLTNSNVEQCPHKNLLIIYNCWIENGHTFLSKPLCVKGRRRGSTDRKPPKRFNMRPSQESGVYTFMNLLPQTSIIEGGGFQGPSPFTVLMIFVHCNRRFWRIVEKKCRVSPVIQRCKQNSCGSVGAPLQSCF